MDFAPDRLVILASASPRRLALLRQLGLEPLVCPAAAPESTDMDALGGPAGLVQANARQKALAVAPGFPQALVIAADTVVVCQGRLLGKPADATDAKAMLQQLSGQRHEVYTGICLAGEGRAVSGADCAQVWFHSLDPGEILSYVAGGESLDKAGAYGIQGAGGWFVQGIQGDYTTVVGLSFSLLRQLLVQFYGRN